MAGVRKSPELPRDMSKLYTGKPSKCNAPRFQDGMTYKKTALIA